MGSLITQLELGITDSHGSRAVIPCTLVDSSTGTSVGSLDYKSSSTSRKKIFIVSISCGFDAVKSKSGVENVTEAGKGKPDFHGFQVVILEDRKGETLYQATDARSLDAKSNTASDRDLDCTRLVAKYIGSEPRLYLESGKGETFKSTELGILESECNYSTARGLCSTRLVAKFTGEGEPDSHGSQAAILKEAISNAGKGQADFHGAQAAILLKEEISTDCKDSGWADSESNTHQDDGTTASKTTTTDSGWADSESSQEGKGETCERTDVCSPDPESNTLQDDGSTASAAVLGGEFNCLTTTEGETCPRTDVPSLDSESTLQEDADSGVSQEGVSSQKIKIGIAGSENNTHLDDGSTSTDKGFMVSEKNTCHVDLSTTADGIVNEAISKDYEGDSHDPQPEISQEVILEARKEKMFTVASSCDSDAVKPNAGKGITISVPDYFGSKVLISNDGKGTRIIIPDYHRSKVVISNDGKDEPDPHARIFTELISNDCKVQGSSMESLPSDIVQESVPVEDGPYPATVIQQQLQMDLSERDTDRYDGLTTKESISSCNDPSFPPTVMPMSGKGKTPQRSDVPGSSTPQEDADSQEAERAFMESLPSDIIQEILSRVPAESVFECKLVCKKWVTLIRGNNFASMHLTRVIKCLHDGENDNNKLAAKVDPCVFFACSIEDVPAFKTLLYHGGQVSDSINNDKKYIFDQKLRRIYHPPMHDEPLTDHLVGSCNGLVCAFQLQNTILDPIYICNPLTREYVYLPRLVVNKEDVDPDLIEVGEVDICEDGKVDMCGRIACGFGYVRSTNEYKIVRIHYLEYRIGNVQVYTLGSGGWRTIGKVPYRLNTSRGGRGTYVNDAISWTSSNKVVAFDLAKEEFRSVPVPSRLENRRGKDTCGLVALGGHLCLYIDDKVRVQIWSLTGSSDSKEVGCMKFDINYEALPDTLSRWIQPILLTKNGEIILLYAESVLYCYDPKAAVLKMISDDASTDYFDAVDAIAHLSTFASLEAMGESSKRYTVRPRRDSTPWDDVIEELDRVALGEEIDATCFRFRSSTQ